MNSILTPQPQPCTRQSASVAERSQNGKVGAFLSNTFQYSIFRHARDNRPRPCESSWGDFVAYASFVFPPDFSVAPREFKKRLPAWSPAMWQAGATRGSYGIEHAQILVLDVDNSLKVITDYNSKGGPVTAELLVEHPAWPEEIRDHLQGRDIHGLIYTSVSNKPDWPKFRVAIPLERRISSADFKFSLEHMLEDLGLNRWRHCFDIKAMREPSRMYFLGSNWHTEAHHWLTEGEPYKLPDPIPTDITLPALSQPTVTPEAQAKLNLIHANLRQTNPSTQTQLNIDSNKWWQNYGFNPAALDLPGLLEGMGFHVGEPQAYYGESIDLDGNREKGYRYQCECPFWGEHSDSDTKSNSRYTAYIIKFPYQTPTFKCFHSHGTDLLKLLFMEPHRLTND